MTMYCANPACGKEIPDHIVKSRHRTAGDTAPMCCDRDCETARRKSIGFFKQMSEAGKDARSTAVATSNRKAPRRKNKKVSNQS